VADKEIEARQGRARGSVDVQQPVLLPIATAVATKAVAGLRQLVRSKFADDPAATAALEQAERTDPEFGGRLRTEREKTTITQTGHVVNQFSGTVHGKVLQADDIHGGVTF
jgi:hypothetical protein